MATTAVREHGILFEKSRCGQAGYAMEPLYSFRTGFVRAWSTLHAKPGERWQDNPSPVRIPFKVLEVR